VLKVVVAGGMGFLGTNVCDMYKGMGEEVIAIDNLTKFELKRNWYDADVVREYNLNHARETGTTFLKDTILNKRINHICKDADYLINCAAQPAMTLAIEDPQYDFMNNLYGLVNLLEISRMHDIPFAHCSSIHVFGNNINEGLLERKNKFDWAWGESINENQPLLDGEITPLHASKRAGEIYVRSYIDTYGLKAAVFRLTGIYGEHQFGGEEHGWVANFGIRTVMNKPITIFGTDKQVRDVLYVGDAKRLFDCFYRNQESGIYNAGGGVECGLSLNQCLRMFAELTNTSQKIEYEPRRKGDLYWFVTDNTKITNALGWKPVTLPNEGLIYLTKWIKEHKVLFDDGVKNV